MSPMNSRATRLPLVESPRRSISVVLELRARETLSMGNSNVRACRALDEDSLVDRVSKFLESYCQTRDFRASADVSSPLFFFFFFPAPNRARSFLARTELKRRPCHGRSTKISSERTTERSSFGVSLANLRGIGRVCTLYILRIVIE